MIDTVVLESAGKETAEVWRFRFKRGWAIFTICNATGEFHITSDWGEWQHRWSPDPKHLGAPTLKRFIADRNACDYLADKLHYGRPQSERSEVDEKATREALLKLIDKAAIGAEEAAELRDQVGEIDISEASSCWFWPEELRDFLGGEPWDHIVTRTPARYAFLQDKLLPFFVEHLKREMAP